MRDPAELARRRALLGAPHIVALRPLLDRLRDRHAEVPDPDPLDGGAEARLLLLLETPGPAIRSTGFVSRDNPTGTAANLLGFLAAAGIAREDTLIWNAVPFVIHAAGATNRAPRSREIADGLACLPPLLDALPRLAVVVLAGRIAALAAPVLAEHRPGLPIFRMPHPSPTYLCTSPEHPRRIAAALSSAALALDSAAPARHSPPLPAPPTEPA